VPVSLTMPNEPEVNIKVFNATQTQGLGASVAADFKNRNFNVAKIDGEKDAAGKDIYYPDEVAILTLWAEDGRRRSPRARLLPQRRDNEIRHQT
jgi:hypothetical protein